MARPPRRAGDRVAAPDCQQHRGENHRRADSGSDPAMPRTAADGDATHAEREQYGNGRRGTPERINTMTTIVIGTKIPSSYWCVDWSPSGTPARRRPRRPAPDRPADPLDQRVEVIRDARLGPDVDREDAAVVRNDRCAPRSDPPRRVARSPCEPQRPDRRRDPARARAGSLHRPTSMIGSVERLSTRRTPGSASRARLASAIKRRAAAS